ncbi:hypothetical protein FYK55_03045 [Roseiconus nitratireducens]|uniref:Uncharacterized protein n=1 Tax=Roseiconus nitratireducens TaxID=2605748 RepID=A0A5M6DHQ8_9BACT|nr:hypothetical protein [Roseiconus nitratireducens]KAA5545906.1 hypothetical protein FYK55_03045 [Roseiconus nitratireducens]
MCRTLSALSGIILFAVPMAAVAEETPAKPADELRRVSGWYQAKEGRHLTILPQEQQFEAVFFWGKNAPRSVGKLTLRDDGQIAFQQPRAAELLEIERKDGKVLALSVANVRFDMVCPLAKAADQYVNEKDQTLTLTEREGQLFCSIDWGNDAPMTRGWVRAHPNGTTVLVGFKWKEALTIQFEGGSIKSISLVGTTFHRAEEGTVDESGPPADRETSAPTS